MTDTATEEFKVRQVKPLIGVVVEASTETQANMGDPILP
jgi:hypothetical protein